MKKVYSRNKHIGPWLNKPEFHSSPYLSMVSHEEVLKQTKYLMDFMQEAIDARVLKPLPIDLLFTLISNHIYGINEYLIAAKMEEAKQKELIDQSFGLIWDMIT